MIPALSGMKDILPEEQRYYRYIFKKADALLEDYGFDRLDTPPAEPSELYLSAAGTGEDQVENQISTFKSRDGQDASFRYDGAASILRAYWENGMHTRPNPIKMFTAAPVWWTDSERKNRQDYHVNAQTIGDASEVVDAELLFLGYKVIDSIGFRDYNVHINTLGDNNCRPAYVRALKDFYKNRLKKVCAKCRNNFKINILRLLECGETECREAMKDAPQAVDFLDEECKNHFKHILEFLDAAQIPYILNPYLVRSQDYYTRTVFEFWPEEMPTGASPLLYGGRHDRLSDLVGGAKMPSAGWTFDVQAAINLLKEKNANIPEVGVKPKVFLVQLGEAAKRKSLLLFEDIRKSGVEIRFSLSRDSIKSQLRIATRLGVRFTLIFGQKEAIEGTVILREMDTGIQETVPLEKIIEELKKRLKSK